MKGHLSMKIVFNISTLAWNDKLYRSLIPFKRNLRKNLKYLFFFLKLLFSHQFLALCLSQKLVYLLTTVFTWDYFTWPRKNAKAFLVLWWSILLLLSRSTSLTSAHSWLMITKRVHNGWKDCLRCLCRGHTQPCKLGLLCINFHKEVKYFILLLFVLWYCLLPQVCLYPANIQ